MSTSSGPPKKGAKVELKGLVGKPELNGCTGEVISKYDPKTGRCGIKLDNGSGGVNAKLANIVILSPELILERALAKLKEAGGREDDDSDSGNEDDSNISPGEYLDELLAVGDARYNLGQYDKAGGIYYNAYYIAMHHRGSSMNNPESFSVAHKMLEAWSKSDDEHYLKMGHGMAQQTLMMPGCPHYIRQDMKKLEKAMNRKGIEVEDIVESLQRNLASVGMGGF